MNVFRFGRGNFWGILIPGGFLFANIFIIYANSFLQNIFSEKGIGYSFIILSFLISYILGYTLRLINPQYVEIISLIIVIPCLIISKGAKKILELIKLDKKFEFFPAKIKDIIEPYPYLNWFYSSHLKKSPKSFRDFYENLKKEEFSGNIENMKGLNFLNFCKRYAIENSNHLIDEIYFVEGLVRFLNGMFYSIMISTILILTHYERLDKNIYPIGFIILLYIFILFVVLIRYKNVRRFEAVICLESYYVVSINNQDKLGKE